MKTFAAWAAFVFAGLASAILTDVVVITVIFRLPSEWDMTASAFVFALLASLIVVAVVTGVLYRLVTIQRFLVYAGAYLIAETVLLTAVGNPAGTITDYLLAVALANAAGLGLALLITKNRHASPQT